MKKQATLYADNGGGLTLKLGKYMHHYQVPEMCAKDILAYWDIGNTRGWDGNEYSELKDSNFEGPEMDIFDLNHPLLIPQLINSGGRAADLVAYYLLGVEAINSILNDPELGN